MNPTLFTFHVGEKFYPDGSVRPYPGNTIICFADATSRIYQAGEALQTLLMQQPYGHKFALLPPDSFHMTVFSLVLDERRRAEEWSRHLPLDAPLSEVDAYFRAKVIEVPAPQGFRMCMTYVGGRGMSFRLCPADEATYNALKNYREQIAQATGVRYPNHDTYEYHLSLAYQLVELTTHEALAYSQLRYEFAESNRCDIGVFETGMPVFTVFEDMFSFVTGARELNAENPT